MNFIPVNNEMLPLRAKAWQILLLYRKLLARRYAPESARLGAEFLQYQQFVGRLPKTIFYPGQSGWMQWRVRCNRSLLSIQRSPWGLRLLIKSAFMKSQRGQKAQKANMPSNFSLTSSYTRILIVMDQNPLQPIEIKEGWWKVVPNVIEGLKIQRQLWPRRHLAYY